MQALEFFAGIAFVAAFILFGLAMLCRSAPDDPHKSRKVQMSNWK